MNLVNPVILSNIDPRYQIVQSLHPQPFLTPLASETRLFPVLSRLQKHQSLAKPRQRKAPV